MSNTDDIKSLSNEVSSEADSQVVTQDHADDQDVAAQNNDSTEVLNEEADEGLAPESVNSSGEHGNSGDDEEGSRELSEKQEESSGSQDRKSEDDAGESNENDEFESKPADGGMLVEENDDKAGDQEDDQDEEQVDDQDEEQEESAAEEPSNAENEPAEEQSNLENDPVEAYKDQQDDSQDKAAAPQSEGTTSNENTLANVMPPANDENVDYNLLHKQAEYIMNSNMLNLPQFQESSQEDKLTALINMLNSNAETALPALEPQENVEEPISVPKMLPVEAKKPFRPDLNGPMTPEERDRYTRYLQGENKITEMHDIPPKSRLFIGNLPLKNVSKEDLFRIFSPYGHILQINIKNAFGFIQYNNPQSVKNAIEKESQELNFGKKLILEISSSNARPQFDHGDHGTNSSSTFISSSKRPFQNEDNEAADMYSDNNQGHKKSKRYVPACVIYVKRTADRGYAYEVFNQFRRGTELETDMIFLKPRMELRRMINEVAHDGVWGVILVNKTRNVDIQTFYKGPQGETKFDEYISISADDAIAIFNNLKPSRGGNIPGVSNVSGMSHGAPYGHQQQAMAGPPQQQGYYGGYGMPAQMPGPSPAQQTPYVQQGYVMPMQNPVYNAPPQMAPPYGRYQSAPAPLAEQVSAPSQLNSILGASGGQMNQQQLLAAIQNLPPNVVSNLLSMAHGQQQQQQQQQQSPQTQQQLLDFLQAMQGQQPPQQQPPQQQQQSAAFNSMAQSVPQMNDNYASQHSSINSAPVPQQPQQQQQQQQQPPAGNNNVQSLLDSLAKLQK